MLPCPLLGLLGVGCDCVSGVFLIRLVRELTMEWQRRAEWEKGSGVGAGRRWREGEFGNGEVLNRPEN